MKYVFVFLLLLPRFAFCQTFIIVEPTNFQVGLMQHESIGKTGLYAGCRYGDIKGHAFYADAFKVFIGASYKIEKHSWLLLGLTAYKYVNISDNNPMLDLNRIKKISFDAGFIKQIDRVYIMALTDPVNWETQFGIGIKF